MRRTPFVWTFVAPLTAALACGSGGEAGQDPPGEPSEPDGSPPAVTVESPAPEALARPRLTISATCTSGGRSCASITVRVMHGGDLLSGTGSVSADVDLSAWEGRAVELVFTGIDRAGRRSEVRRFVYVESSGAFGFVAAVPGPIWDYAGGRILFVDVTGPSPVLRLRDTRTGATEDLEAGADVLGTWGCYGYVTSSGAIYAHGEQQNETYPYCWAHEWREGASVELGGLNSCQSLRVAGSYAIFSTQPVPDAPITLVRRDLRTGATAEVSVEAGNSTNDVAANGDVVYWTHDHEVYRWREGVTEALTSDAPASFSMFPLTDGSAVVYRKTNPADWTHALVLHDGRGEITLRPAEAGEPLPGWDYAIANGWVAYTRAGSTEVWRHSASGEELLAALGEWSAVEGVAPDGTVLLTSGSHRYRAVPGRPLEEIGSALGRIVYREGAFYAIVGAAVLEVRPSGERRGHAGGR